MSKVKKIIGSIAVIIALLIIAFCIVVCAQRWWFVDDSSDIVGKWQKEGSSSVVEVTGEKIKLTDDIICAYTLDDSKKSLELKLDSKTGSSHYVFSQDRTELLIIDENLDFFSSFSLDMDDFFKSLFNGKLNSSSAGFLDSSIPTDKIVRLKKVA